MQPIDMKDAFDSLRDNPDVRYAAKHPVESHFGLNGIFQCDVYRPRKNLKPGQHFVTDQNGKPIRNPKTGAFLISGGMPEPFPNTFTTEGIARMLNIMFHDISKAGSEIWYVGIYKNNVTPAVGNTASVHLGAAGTYGACQATTDFDEEAYQSYTTADTETASITNSVAGTADFTIADTITIYGAFLGSSSDPTDTTGYLMSAKKFGSSRSVVDDDAISITYTISVSTS